MSERILIAGGTGLLGRALARRLATSGREIVLLSRAAARSARALHLPPGCRVESWDGRTANGWLELASGAEAIVSSASACGLMVKDYVRLLAGDGVYAARAERVSAATRDLAEIVEPDNLRRLGCEVGSGPRVAWQSPCTLQHGQRVAGRVEALLEAAGCTLTPTSEATLCCGSAGTYSILQPAMSGRPGQRKSAGLTGNGPEVIATANIGCLEHLRAESPVPVRHWIEIVADSITQP